MDYIGTPFPGIPSPGISTESQRSYSYDPMGTLSQQQSHYPEWLGESADNNTWVTPQGSYRGVPQGHPPDGFLGNIELMKPMFFSDPGWYGECGVGGINNNWDDLRQEGIGYGLYNPHLPMQPVPAQKLYEPGSGFVLPATFLGQPLAPMAKPPGT